MSNIRKRILTVQVLVQMQAYSSMGDITRFLLNLYRQNLQPLPKADSVNALQLRAVAMLQWRATMLGIYMATDKEIHQENQIALIVGFVSQLIHAASSAEKTKTLLAKITQCSNEVSLPGGGQSLSAGRTGDEFLARVRNKVEHNRLLRRAISEDPRLETFLDDLLKHDNPATVFPPAQSFMGTYRPLLKDITRQFMDELMAMLAADVREDSNSALFKLAYVMQNGAAHVHLTDVARRKYSALVS